MSDTPRTDAITIRMAAELDRPLLQADHMLEMCDHARALERELDAQKVCISDGMPKWIACAERRPVMDRSVIVWRARFGGEYNIDRIGVAGDWIFRDGWTHWMPLPGAPK